MLGLVFLMGVGPMLPWREGQLGQRPPRAWRAGQAWQCMTVVVLLAVGLRKERTPWPGSAWPHSWPRAS